jgi:hypothetical protein
MLRVVTGASYGHCQHIAFKLIHPHFRRNIGAESETAISLQIYRSVAPLKAEQCPIFALKVIYAQSVSRSFFHSFCFSGEDYVVFPPETAGTQAGGVCDGLGSNKEAAEV